MTPARSSEISSAHNPALARIRRLRRRTQRERAGLFVAEGEDLLEAADAAGWPARERLCAAGSGLPGRPVAPGLLAELSNLGSGTRALAVFAQRWSAVHGPLCVYLHGVADPGNVGTVLRGALAFGAACVALGPGCADPYGPKAVRASMGAIFGVDVARATPDELPGRWIALDAHAGERLRGPAPEGDVTLLVGAERSGLSGALLARSAVVARIPIAAESLNAAMAATVALYELTRMHAGEAEGGGAPGDGVRPLGDDHD